MDGDVRFAFTRVPWQAFVAVGIVMAGLAAVASWAATRNGGNPVFFGVAFSVVGVIFILVGLRARSGKRTIQGATQ